MRRDKARVKVDPGGSPWISWLTPPSRMERDPSPPDREVESGTAFPEMAHPAAPRSNPPFEILDTGGGAAPARASRNSNERAAGRT